VYTGLGIPEGVTGRLPKDKRTRAGLSAEQVEDIGETGKRQRSSDSSRKDGRRTGGKDRRGSDKPRAEKPNGPRKDRNQGEKRADAPSPRRRRRRTRGGQETKA